MVAGRNRSSTFSPNSWSVGYNRLVFLHMFMKIMLHPLFFLYHLEASVSLLVQLRIHVNFSTLEILRRNNSSCLCHAAAIFNLQSHISHVKCSLIETELVPDRRQCCSSSWWGCTLASLYPPMPGVMHQQRNQTQRKAGKESVFTFPSLPCNTMRVISQAG